MEARVAQLEAQLSAAAEKVANLESALVSARRIGAAIGVLMTVRRVTEDEVFDVLRVASQNTNRKLRDVAEDVLYAGDIGDLTPEPDTVGTRTAVRAWTAPGA